MSEVPAITVLLPVRDDARFLGEALDSLRKQSRQEWTALLCPLGDTAHGAASTLAATDPRLSVAGLPLPDECAALAHAAANVETEFLCVLDADDLLEPAAFATLLDTLRDHTAAGMAYSRHVLIDANGAMLGPDPLDGLAYSPEALLLDFMTGPLRLMHTAAYRDAGGYRAAHPYALDYDLCLRLSETTDIVRVPQVLYRRRIHPHMPGMLRWAEGIEARYAAFVDAVKRRGLDATHDVALHIDSWHILQPLQQPRPFGGVGNWR